MVRRLVGIALLALLILTPVAAASHTMGHRYLVHGRLIDSQGMPLQNQDVTLKIKNGATALASIVTRTDCLGDFESWDGEPGTDPPPQGGLGQEPGLERQTQHDPPYVAFHFHSFDLSDRYKVEVSVGSETWEESFHSRERQTLVQHQLGFAGSAACGSYDEFNTTFTYTLAMLSNEEWETGDVEPKARTVSVALDGASRNGTTDFNGHFVAKFQNVTPASGTTLSVSAADLGSRTYTLDETALLFRRIGTVQRLGDSPGEVLDDLKNFGIVVLVIALVVGVWLGGRKLRARMEEKRLRETSTRRRFRRQQQP